MEFWSLVAGLFRFILKNKWKFLGTISFVFIFTFLLFPFKDLNDFISSQVSQLSQKKVYLQFDDMHINPLTTTVTLDKVALEAGDIENLLIDELSATPSIMALVKKQPGGKLSAQGLFGGFAEVKLSPLSAEKSSVEISAQKLSLKELLTTFKISIPMSGKLSMNSKITADLAFVEQPDGEINATIDNFEMPSTAVNLPDLGSLNLPELKFKQIDIKGKLSGGKFIIENGKLGNPTDDFSGTVKGDLSFSFQKVGGQIVPVRGGYNLSLDLVAKAAFKDKAQFFLNFIDQFKTEENGATRYKFKLQAATAEAPPQMLAP